MTTKKTKATKRQTKATPTSKTDKWGGRLGTGVAAINAAIGSKPISVIDLAKKLKRNLGAVRCHVRTLVKVKKVCIVKDGMVSIKSSK